MERRKEKEKQASVQWRLETNFVTGVPQGQSIFNNMQYNHQPNSDRRRFGLENIPGLYNMSYSQLLALANNTAAPSLPSSSLSTHYLMDSLFPANNTAAPSLPSSSLSTYYLMDSLFPANNTAAPSLPSSSPSTYYLMDSWIPMETNPWFLNPGSSIDINSGFLRERTMQTPQYDVSTPQKFVYDLNLPPQEMLRTSLQSTAPEFITLDTPFKRLSETNQKQPHVPIKESFETGSSSGVKKGKRARYDEKSQLKTPALKRKKIRPKVVSEGKPKRVSSKAGTTKSPVPVAAATATKISEGSSHVRPKRSSIRSLRYDSDFLDDDYEYCGLDFSSEDHSSAEEPTYTTTLGIFGNIPKGIRQMRTNPIRIHLSSEQANDCLSSMMSLVNKRPTTTLRESENDLPSYSNVSQRLRRKRSNRRTRARKFKELVKSNVSNVPIKWDTRGHKHPANFYKDRFYSTLPTKKRRQRDPIASQINARILSLQWQRLNPKGTSFADMWERSLTNESITKLFEQLDINREGPYLPHNKETALILHKKENEEQQAIVKNSKKQKLQIQMDSETTRVWKLLMSSSDSDGVDGTDEEKRKWWNEERSMFHDRANLFISRMSKVQGDRTFSPWKGSVVDSVVGVFLTQAVADHSSSSAYMDLAAQFPVKDFYKGSSAEELGSSVTHETVMNLCPTIAVSTPRIRNPNCVIIEEIDDDDDNIDALSSQESSKIIDALSSQESTKTNDSSSSSTNESKLILLNPFHTDGLDILSQGMVSSTSTHLDLNLNEVPPEIENYDAFINQASEDSQVYISSHQQELVNTLQAENQDKNTGTEDKKKSTTSRPVGQPPENKSKESTKKKAKEPAKKKAKESAKSKLEESFDWDILRKQAESGGKKRERTERTMDTVDWEALRSASVNKIAAIIRKRGMNNMLAERIKAFLDRLVLKHGSIDLEWLRDVPPKQAKDYLLSINGLGLKSVECVRLLSLRQVAFPVDTNVGRIAVRLGWVPLQPLPDELQMHLLELYPVLNSVQKYLWPRLCKLDQKTLYELHYHMITFGKVFCTKVKPNCNACPMKSECRHYASATTSARLALPEPEESDTTSVMIHEYKHKPFTVNFQPSLFLTHGKEQVPTRSQNCEPIIEEPTSPEPQHTEHDIEDYPWDNNNNDLISRIIESGSTSKDLWEDTDIIPTIILNKEAETSKDLVVVSTSIPGRKLKVTEKLRTEHHVYELPDDHFILEGFEKREEEDKVPYLLAIWTPGETADSIEPPRQRCVFQGNNTLCHENKCFECNKIREEESKIVRGTILIPCRTAMRGGFPLNGTYFQTNEVFADHGSSINPIAVPRDDIWKLPRRVAYFGSAVREICKGLSMADIKENFEEGYVCVRGFDREDRRPMPLAKRLHWTPNKQEPSTAPRKRGRKPSKSKSKSKLPLTN